MTPPPEIPPELRRAGDAEQRLRDARGLDARSDMKQRLIQVSAIGTEFAVAVVGGGLLGWLLDWWLGTAPWFLLGGCVFGLVWGFIRFVRTGLELAGGRRENAADEPGPDRR